MALYCMDVNETIEHIYSGDKEKESPTKWTIGNIDSLLYLALEDQNQEVSEENGKKIIRWAYNRIFIECFRYGVHNADNLKDHKGNIMQFKRAEQYAYGKKRMAVEQSIMESIAPS